MALPKSTDLLLRRFEEIESNIRNFMNLQFEHNNFFRKELKEQRDFLGLMNKELDDTNTEFYGMNSQIIRVEKAIAQISDKQATLVNKMASELEKLDENNDEDLKVIDVSPIRSLFCNMNLENNGTGSESTFVKKCFDNLEFLDLDAKFGKSGIGEVMTLNSIEPTMSDFKEFDYDNCSLEGCISLLQSVVNSPHANSQNKAFTKHIVDALMQSFDEKLNLEVSIPRKLNDEWEPTIKIRIKDPECFAFV